MPFEDLQQFLARCPMPAFLVEPMGSGFLFRFANPPLASAAGMAPESILGRGPAEVFPEALAEALLSRFRHAHATREVADITASLPHAGGARDWDIVIIPVVGYDGQVAALAAYGIDPGEMARRRLAHQTDGRWPRDAYSAQEAMVCRSLPDGTLAFVNAAYARLLGRNPWDLLGRPFLDLLPVAEYEELLRKLTALSPTAPSCGSTCQVRMPDGRQRWHRWVSIGAFNADGLLLEIYSVGHDISEVHEAEFRARESERRFRTVVDNIADGVALADARGRILYANSRLAEILGWPAEAFHGRDILQLAAPPDPACAPFPDAVLRGSLKGGTVQESAVRHRDGRLLRLHLALSEVELDGARHFIGIIRNNTTIHEAQRRIERLAFSDELTGLPNQRRLKQELATLLAQSGAHPAVLLIDLVDFSALNGTIGFAAGDRMLNSVAQRIAAVLPHGTLLARFGNDRFAVLVREPASAEAPMLLAEQIAVAVEGALPNSHEDGAFRLPPVTIGVAVAPQDDTQANSLLEAVEMALLEAKRGAPGSIRRFSAEMRVTAGRRFSIAQGLRRALDGGGLFIEVQPRFTADTRIPTGGEALIRWRREDGSLIPPADFMPLAEETGLIQPITDFVFDQVTPLLAQLRDGQRISMNFPPAQLARHNLTTMIAARLDREGVPGDRLGLELTESAMIDGPGLLDENLRELRRMGCSVAIDDFGTGYSSLSRLRNLPIDEVKIDRIFIRDAARDAAGTAFLRAIGSMAKALDLRLVAEGVETERELAEARAIGCHEVQGWLWGRPMAPEEFLGLCRAG